jgi:hypothetical protein
MIDLKISDKPPYPGYSSLPLRAGQVRLFLDWELEPEPADAGLPPELARTIAESLVQYFGVLFLQTPPDSSASGKWLVSSPRTCQFKANKGLFPGNRHITGLCFSSDAQVVATMFEDAHHDWTQRGQFALLFSLDYNRQSLDGEAIINAIESEDISVITDADGYMRPGDDGDFIELALPGQWAPEFIATLRQSAKLRQVQMAG